LISRLASPPDLAFSRAAFLGPKVYQFRVELPKNSLGKVLKDELTLS
jgi:hypothetical protein